MAEKKEKPKKKGRFYGRVTVDFPHDVYDDMKEMLKNEGRTMKFYLIKLVEKDLASREEGN